MVVFATLEAALSYCERPGPRNLEIVVTQDTRSIESITYAAAFDDVKRLWAAGSNRVYLRLQGDVPSMEVHYYWYKVGVVRQVTSTSRARYVAWLDSDAVFNLRAMIAGRRAKEKYLDISLSTHH